MVRHNLEKITLAVTGDSLIVCPIPPNDGKRAAIRQLLMQHDVRFTHLETAIHEYERDIYPSRHSGGDWIAARPGVLSDLTGMGFNLLSAPSNHSMDWSHNGLMKTVDHLKREGVAYAGIGANLAEASRPAYLDTAAGRVALIAINSSFRDWHPAGEQRHDFIGRPGIHALHFKTIHRISERQMETLREIGAATEINKRVKQTGKRFKLGELLFELGEGGTYTEVDEADAERVRLIIREASRQADFVLISCHSHEMRGLDKSAPADFQLAFARMCIDEGAHMYAGHGPHVLRGVELYRERPIFHGLGDLFYEAELIEKQPAEFYEKYGRLSDRHCTADGYDYRYQSGLGDKMNNERDQRTYASVIGAVAFEGGRLARVELHPVTLGYALPRSQRGHPELAATEDGLRILHDMRALSEPFGTTIDIENGVGIVRLMP